MAHHQEEGREAFARLLYAVGTGAFGGQVIDYLRSYLAIDRAIVALFACDGSVPPDLLFHNLTDARATELYLSYLQHHGEIVTASIAEAAVSLIGVPASPSAIAFTRDLRAFLGMEAELRLAMSIDEREIAVILLSKREWADIETDFALRCASFLRPTILAHIRSRRVLGGGTEGSDWRLDHVRSSIGDDKLTAREFGIAMMILAGGSTMAIAEKLDISIATVKVHRRHIYAKLNISCQAELFALAFRRASF
ncbi:MAG: LuxR C-terminal-related transcriptional regulator [Sphingobium sp.]